VRKTLNPVLYPRATLQTRIPHFIAATALAFIQAQELQPLPPVEPVRNAAPAEPTGDETEESGQAAPDSSVSEVAGVAIYAPPDTPCPEPGFVPEPEFVPVLQPGIPVAIAQPLQLGGSVPADIEAEFRQAEQIWLARLRQLQEAARQARLKRAAAARRFELARDSDSRLTADALAARERADRIRERYEALLADSVVVSEEIGVDAARLLLDRDLAEEKLRVLLQTCTEEHPFVRQARRELAALEAVLAKMNLKQIEEKEAQARDDLRRSLYLEWEAADHTAANLAERRRRLEADLNHSLADLNGAEQQLSLVQADLARHLAKRPPPPVVVQIQPAPVAVETPAPQPEPDGQTPLPEPAEPAAPTVAPSQPRPSGEPVFLFSPIPERIVVSRQNNGPEAIVVGALAGLCFGLIWSLVKEAMTQRFSSAAMARRMVHLPLLAIVPAYDQGSFKAAARTMKGDIVQSGHGRAIFAPVPVDISEPAPAGKRSRVKTKRRRRRVWQWLAAACLLALALSVPLLAEPWLIRMGGGGGTLSLPGAAECAECLQSDAAVSAEWGGLP
ncbi:MAG: hypothetical protein LIP23_09840, partial [Planctomycetes bacterium]|nr:hypothetical protein [Planctomycetota bacterium]